MLMATDPDALRLIYNSPARTFLEALPVGNGRLGAMVYGHPSAERIQFNEDTLWSGGPHDNCNPRAAAALPEVRRLVFQNRCEEAQQIVQQDLMGCPPMMQAYQPFGELRLRMPGHGEVKEYRRELDLREGMARVSYRTPEGAFRREVFASWPAQVIVVRVEADPPAKVSFDASLASPHPGTQTLTDGPNLLRMTGQLGTRKAPDPRSWTAPWTGNGIRFEARLCVTADGGTAGANGDAVQVRNADSATLLLAAATSFVDYRDISADPAIACQRCIVEAARAPFAELRANHVADFRRIFDSVKLNLGTSQVAQHPTDQRLGRLAEGSDPALAALYFQYGRYLLISSSRPGTQAATLQGIWNDDTDPWWGSKYTININIQMNYWPAEVTNLSECHEPLFDLLEDLRETGGRVARLHYGCGGFVGHHNTDIWRQAAAVDGAGTFWPTGGAWLATHLFEHYLFTGDEEFLRRRAWPLMKGAAQFLVEFLVEIPDGLPWAGRLVTNPSSSPENAPQGSGHPVGRVTYGPTIDLQIIHQLFTQCIQAAEILGEDQAFARLLQETLDKLAPLQIGRHGQLQEWIGDWDDPESKHHHVSHLFGLYPGSQIAPDAAPELAAAARQSLIHRDGSYGGFPGVWRAALWARLRDAQRAYSYLCAFDKRMKYPSLFGHVSQLDGLYGVTACIAELLLQSHARQIELLPALPEAWPAGSVQGLCARGAFEVDIAWQEGRLTGAEIHSRRGSPATVRYEQNTVEFPTEADKTYRLNGQLQLQ